MNYDRFRHQVFVMYMIVLFTVGIYLLADICLEKYAKPSTLRPCQHSASVMWMIYRSYL